ncbi:MAG: hypothetical protein IPK37_04600 [Austwickia sp.]|jgi:hypothetical protein|nr:MAG: hypothetical protein IPK37_04600 [Austwickia sp.]
MSVAATPWPGMPTREPARVRLLAAVRDEPRAQEGGGIWSDAAYAVEADELTTWLRGLARLEAEVLSV